MLLKGSIQPPQMSTLNDSQECIIPGQFLREDSVPGMAAYQGNLSLKHSTAQRWRDGARPFAVAADMAEEVQLRLAIPI